MTLLFVHGWAYDSSVWDGVRARLDDFSTHCLDFGYFGPTSMPVPADDSVIAVGHSLGVLWLLAKSDVNIKGFISIAGFDNYAAHTRPAVLKAMQLGLARRTERTLRDFWTACGSVPQLDMADAHLDRLSEGLSYLAELNGEAALAQLSCPLLALASRDDNIVSEEMTKAIWPAEQLRWVDEGGHALPVTQTEWCADEIAKFASAL